MTILTLANKTVLQQLILMTCKLPAVLPLQQDFLHSPCNILLIYWRAICEIIIHRQSESICVK